MVTGSQCSINERRMTEEVKKAINRQHLKRVGSNDDLILAHTAVGSSSVFSFHKTLRAGQSIFWERDDGG